MTNKDKQIWTDYARGVSPVRTKKKRPAPAPRPSHAHNDKHPSRVNAEKAPPQPPRLHAAVEKDLKAAALDRKREKALRQGDIAIDGKIDLHGMTQTQAFAALGSFLRRKVKTGKRCLLVVTGKGRGGDGVLKRSLESWLNQLPEASAVLALRPAAPQHGGDGAFYVILRKPRATKD